MIGLAEVSCPAMTSLPALDLQASALSGVYFVQQGESGPIKIGWSRNVRSRLATLQTATHERLRLLLVLGGKPEDERRLHSWFAHERRGGEWFHSDGEVGAFVAAKLARPAEPVGTARCDGRQPGEPCWGDVRRYSSDDDWFCEGHWEAREGCGYLPEPPHFHGPNKTDEMGRHCQNACGSEPCWGEIVRVADFDDTYCEAHHPIDGVYAAIRNEVQGGDPGPSDLYPRLVALEERLSECIRHLGTSAECNGPEFVKSELWDVLSAVESLRKQAGSEP